MTPVTLAAAILLGLLRVGVGMTVLRKEARQMLLRHCGSTLGQSGVDLVVELVRPSHFGGYCRGAAEKAQITDGSLELAVERMMERGDEDGNGSVGRGLRGFMELL